MALEAKLLRINAKTSTGTQAYTGVGFEPKVIIPYGVLTAGDGAVAASYFHFGIGVNSSSRVGLSMVGEHDTKNHSKERGQSDEHVIYATNPTGTILLSADLDSMDSDGFTLDFTANTLGFGYWIPVLCLGGDDLTDVALENITSPASTGTQSYTGAGFQPDLILATSVFNHLALPGTINNSLISIGWGTGAADGDQFAAATYARDTGSATDAARYFDEGKLLVLPNYDATALYASANIDSIDASGVTLNWTVIGTAGQHAWLLYLKGGQHKIGTFQEPTSTTAVQTGDPGFGGKEPKGIVNLSVHWTVDSIGTHSRFMLGAATDTSGTDHGCIYVNEQDKGGDSVCRRVLQSDEVSIIYDSDGSLISEAHVSDYDSSTGVEFNWTTADGFERDIGYWTFADNANAAEGAGGVTMGGTAVAAYEEAVEGGEVFDENKIRINTIGSGKRIGAGLANMELFLGHNFGLGRIL